MTDTTDIKALREHNRHIVAHLTRSNPRRPLSSAEVLTLESARLVVAALSVRDGLPDADHSEYWFEHEGKLLFDGALFNSRVEIFIESKLEAERQRADYGQQVLDQRNAECDRLINEIAAERQRADMSDARIVELEKGEKYWFEEFKQAEAALKGDQVPVAYLIHEKAKPARLSFQNLKGFVSQSDIEEHELWQEDLFTGPQKPVVLPEIISALYRTSFHESYRAIAVYRVNDVKAAIEAAGGKVAE